MVGVVGVSRLDSNLRAFLRFGQGEGAVGRARDFFTVSQPLVFDFALVNAVLVCHLCGQGFAHFGDTTDSYGAFVVGRWWRRSVITHRIGRAAGNVFGVVGVVGVRRLDGNFRPFLCFWSG